MTMMLKTYFIDAHISLCQVTQGVSEFKPTPSENRDCFKCLYNVEHTLLVCLMPYTLELILERWLA